MKKTLLFKQTFILFLIFEITSSLYFEVICNQSNPNIINIRNAFYYKRKRPHPYLGYQNSDSNFSQYLLDKEDKSKYKIGIFGGSVAQQFCEHELKNNYIKNQMNKRVEIICFAQGGYRQPQQTLAFSLYGAYLDHALFIEGSNEFTSRRLRHHIEYPLTRLSSAWYTTTDDFFLTQMKLYISEKLLIWGRSPNLTFLYSEDSIRKLSQILSQQLIERDTVTNIDSFDIETLSKVWKKSLMLLDTVSSRSKIKVDVVIQPFIGSKKNPTTHEKKFLKNSTYSKKFETYSNNIKKLPLENIKVTSYLNFFEDSQTKDFLDDVHLTPSALNRMWEKIVKTHF